MSNCLFMLEPAAARGGGKDWTGGKEERGQEVLLDWLPAGRCAVGGATESRQQDTQDRLLACPPSSDISWRDSILKTLLTLGFCFTDSFLLRPAHVKLGLL